MSEPTPEEFKAMVLERKAEVLAILYLDASMKWSTAHIEVAKSTGEVTTLKAEIYYWEMLLAQERRRSSMSEPLGNG